MMQRLRGFRLEFVGGFDFCFSFCFFFFWFSSWGVVPFDVFNISRFLILVNNYFQLFFMARRAA